MNIRQAREADAPQLIELFDTLATETKFMLPEPNERQVTIDEQKTIVKGFVDAANRIMLIAENTDLLNAGLSNADFSNTDMSNADFSNIDSADTSELLRFVIGNGNTMNRNKHAMYCVIGIRQSATGQGLGFKLLEQLQTWAVEHGITRMELTVLCHNVHAKKLYEKFGFEVEGIKRQSMKIDGEYFDEYMMSKLLEYQL